MPFENDRCVASTKQNSKINESKSRVPLWWFPRISLWSDRRCVCGVISSWFRFDVFGWHCQNRVESPTDTTTYSPRTHTDLIRDVIPIFDFRFRSSLMNYSFSQCVLFPNSSHLFSSRTVGANAQTRDKQLNFSKVTTKKNETRNKKRYCCSNIWAKKRKKKFVFCWLFVCFFFYLRVEIVVAVMAVRLTEHGHSKRWGRNRNANDKDITEKADGHRDKMSLRFVWNDLFGYLCYHRHLFIWWNKKDY